MSKEDAYQWLAAILAAPMNQAHIGLLGEYCCMQVIEESKKVSHLDIQRKNILDRRNSLKAKACLVCLRNNKKVNVAREG